MKTLEQAAQQRANKFSEVIVEGTEIPCLIEDLNLWAKEDFKKGFEFANKWYSFKDHRPPYYKTCLVKVHEKTEPIAAWLANTGDSDIWTICSTDIILPPVKLWRPIF